MFWRRLLVRIAGAFGGFAWLVARMAAGFALAWGVVWVAFEGRKSITVSEPVAVLVLGLALAFFFAGREK